MIKTIAIIMDKGGPSKEIKEDTTVNIFRMKDDKVFSHESIKLDNNSNDHFSSLLKLKEISLIYMDTITNDLKYILSKLGIGIKCKDEWDNDKFISQFVFS